MNKKNNRSGSGNNSKSDPLEESLTNPSRRNLLKGAGLVGAAAVSTIATSHVIAADSTNMNSNSIAIAPREALEALTAEEAETLAAICDCLIPSDEHGPGAREARAVHYIDKSLASHNSEARHNYSVGLNAINEFARQTRGKFFPELPLDQQNSILLAVQTNKISGFIPNGSASSICFAAIRSTVLSVILIMEAIRISSAGICCVIQVFALVRVRRM